MLDEKESVKPETSNEKLTIEDARRALEDARAAENKAYYGLAHAAALTKRQEGILELAAMEETEQPDREQLDKKCRLILESYYLPHILKSDFTVKLDKDFTRFDDPGQDYIEAVFTAPSGKERKTAYNYKTEEDGKNLLIFEKTFENVVLKPGEPEKYVLYAADGTTEKASFSTEEIGKKVSRGEVVKVEEGYFLKAADENGEPRPGDTTAIVEEEGDSNVKIIMGNNEQEKFSVSKTGQLVCATMNDVTTVTVETRKFSGEPVYDSADAARAAAEKEIREGETNPHIDVTMEGTTVADFSYIPSYTTSVELAGISRKLGKGIEGYNPDESDEENLRRQFAKPISEYLSEKGFYVFDITCENIEADVKENVGFMNTIKTYQMTGGTVSVTYTKKFLATVTLKQKFLGRVQTNDIDAVLAQLPQGSELLNPQDIDWKNSKPEVAYIVRGNATGVGSAQTIPEADQKAVHNAILEAQKVVVRAINGGIASGIREAMAGKGAASTVANVRARIDSAAVSANDMQLTHKDTKYAYSGSCDRLVSSVENKLVSVTTWNGGLLTYVEPTDPIIERGIPSDENYQNYIENGDDMAILLFEKSDRGLRRYMEEVKEARSQAEMAVNYYEKTRLILRQAQETFDRMFDAGTEAIEAEPETEEPIETPAEAETPAAAPVETEAAASVEAEAPTETPAETEAVASVEAEAPTEESSEASAEEALTEASIETPAEEPIETPAEAEAPTETPVETETVASVEAAAPTETPVETEAAASAEAVSDEDIDAAWEKLLMGIPKED